MNLQHIVESSKSEEPDSKYPRMVCDLKFDHGKKWKLFINSYTHGSYSDEDCLVMEDGEVEEL